MDTHEISKKLADFLELVKPRITLLVLFVTFVGFYMGNQGPVQFWRLAHTLVGTALVAAGAGAFNMYAERGTDALMKRTARRPLAAGRVQSQSALLFALASSTGGFIYLFIFINHLSSLLSAIIFASYVFLYTPLKTKTWLCTLVGAIPGALPMVLGWSTVHSILSPRAWSLFAIVYLWQLPHFYSIGWMYREDYGRAGFPVLPVIDYSGRRIGRQAVLFIAALIIASLLPAILRLAGLIYLVGAAALGCTFFVLGLRFARSLDQISSRILFSASALYLPALLVLLILDKIG